MTRGLQIVIAVSIGLLLDAVWGDPQWIWHPVRGMGWCITVWEKITRRVFPKSPVGERIGGTVTALITMLLSTGIPTLLLILCYAIGIQWGLMLECLFCYQMFAAKSLQTESMKVYHALQGEGLEKAREKLSMIVSRDTQNLSQEEVLKATVETIAENTSDGVVAPLFFAILGGAPLLFFYKACSTLDSMIGYKNEKYLHFGRTAARMDDFMNFIPARLCALFMIGASFILPFDGRAAYRIWKRDRRKHTSPNAAQPESVVAGALQIQLAGSTRYFGKVVDKPRIGDSVRAIDREDIKRACRLMWGTTILAAAGMILIRLALGQYWGAW